MLILCIAMWPKVGLLHAEEVFIIYYPRDLLLFPGNIEEKSTSSSKRIVEYHRPS